MFYKKTINSDEGNVLAYLNTLQILKKLDKKLKAKFITKKISNSFSTDFCVMNLVPNMSHILEYENKF